MKNIHEIKNYRTKFKRYYNIEFSNFYEIHHIDLNHDNNDINNLMILPKVLHREYHRLLSEYSWVSNGMNTKILSVIDGGNGWNEIFINSAVKFFQVYQECQKWKDYLEYLKGNIPNIHNIELR